MEPKVNYTLVGLFIALLGAALLAGVLWLSQTDYRGVYDRYYTYMEESVVGFEQRFVMSNIAASMSAASKRSFSIRKIPSRCVWRSISCAARRSRKIRSRC